MPAQILAEKKFYLLEGSSMFLPILHDKLNYYIVIITATFSNYSKYQYSVYFEQQFCLFKNNLIVVLLETAKMYLQLSE